MAAPERIVVNSEILAGKPVIRGTRLAVEFILELLATGQSESDILACLSLGSYLAHEFKGYPIPA